MTVHETNGLLRQLRTFFAGRKTEGQTDQFLLEQFLSHRDEEAFAALLNRHGPMVLNVCLRVLHDEHLAEEAYQATFLILAHKAVTIRKYASVGSWLHGVALRLARHAKTESARSKRPDARSLSRTAIDPQFEASWREVQGILDDELQRLPENYRLPLVLCYLEGLTRDEAAAQLGWSAGKLRGLLERGRAQLHTQLVRRGVTLSAAGAATLLADAALSASVPPLLAVATVRAAGCVASGTALAACGISAPVVALAEGGLMMLASKKMSLILALALFTGLLGTGVGIFGQRSEPIENQPSVEVAAVQGAKADDDWLFLKKGELLAVDVERCLYEAKGEKRFLMAVRLTNLTKGEIGVDWQDPRPRLYPNQWGVHDTKQREIVDERRTVYAAPDQDKVRADFQAGRLTRISAGKFLIVWTEFNNSGRADVDAAQGKYFIVSMDGQFCATDGAKVDTISCAWKNGIGSNETDLVMPFPVKWQTKQDKLPLPGGNAALPELTKQCRGAVVATLQKIGDPEPGPPGAADYVSKWKVEKVLRGTYPEIADLSFRVQSLPIERRERSPTVGQKYILITHEVNANQVAAILDADEKNIRKVQDLLMVSFNRWDKLLQDKKLTAKQRTAYEQIAKLHAVKINDEWGWGMISLPSFVKDSKLPTDLLYAMGLDALPTLAEALDDETPTATVITAREGSFKQVKVWQVNDFVALLIVRIADRDFVIGEFPKELGIRDIAQQPKAAPEFRKRVVEWHRKFAAKTQTERKLADVTDPWFRNRFDAIIAFGNGKVKEARAPIAARVDAFYGDPKREASSLTQAEMTHCALALGQIGDRVSLSQVRRVCADLSHTMYMSYRPLDQGRWGRGSAMNEDLFRAYHGLALLGEKDAAVTELKGLLTAYGAEMEPATRKDYENRLKEAIGEAPPQR